MAKSSSLNHAYKLVWSHVLNAWVVVSEIAKSRGKSKSQKVAALVSSTIFATATWAGPEGGVVTGGIGNISQDGAVTTINQSSQTLNLNWNTFNVASHETVNFVQPSATALAVNQILDTNGSRIMGNINANGQVWLINPNGIYFGAGAQVNVGSLLASTLNPLANTNGTQVFGNGGTGSVVNDGTINATNGYVAFIGNTVSNTGNITANGGTVAMGAGSQVSLKFADNQLLSFTVDQSTLNNLAENKGLIQANGGAVFLSAGARDSLLASVVNNEGVIEAKTVDHKAGKIMLMGGMAAGQAAGTYQFSGNSHASVENKGSIQVGEGGLVALAASKVVNRGNIEASKGTVGLAAGKHVRIDLGSTNKVEVTEGALNATVEQSGSIRADGGQIYLAAKTAGNHAASVINHTGSSRALNLTGSSEASTASIRLNADLINQAGTLDVSGTAVGRRAGQIDLQAALLIDSGTTKADGQTDGGRITQRATEIQQAQSATISAVGHTGKGGLVEYLGGTASGGNVYLSGRTLAKGLNQGGQIDATANSLTLAGATLDTSGTTSNAQAGKQRIGGGWQGKDTDLNNAISTLVTQTSTINNLGKDGMVVVWSDAQTTYAAALNAEGSAVEVSGKENLAINTDGIRAKSLLLDPKNLEIKNQKSLNFKELSDPLAGAASNFGAQVLQLSNQNLVVTASNANVGGVTGAGRVYLYNSAGQLIATLSGSTANEGVGGAGLTTNNVGTPGVTELKGNGNFLVGTNGWDADATNLDVGAVTWMNGATGALSNGSIGGVVGASNSVVGSKTGDIQFTTSSAVGTSRLSALNTGHALLLAASYDGAGTNRGAVAWLDGNTGKLADGSVAGTLSASNALVGPTDNSLAGGYLSIGRVTRVQANTPEVLANGNVLIGSPMAGRTGAMPTNLATYKAPGAITWMNASTGKLSDGSVGGAISTANSLIDNTNDAALGTLVFTSGLSQTIVTQSNNNALIAIKSIGINTAAGSATWINGDTGRLSDGTTGGVVSSQNSLVASTATDLVSYLGVNKLNSGNFLVNSYFDGKGAVTFINGQTGALNTGTTGGALSTDNSWVGGVAADFNNLSVFNLSNGNALMLFPQFSSAGVNNVGVVAWLDGRTGILSSGSKGGLLSDANSFLGNVKNDSVGFALDSFVENTVTEVAGNVLIASPNADVDGKVNAGALTWMNGSNGRLLDGNTGGRLSALNSLVGSSTNEKLGYSIKNALVANDNLLLQNPLLDVNGQADVGGIAVVNARTGKFANGALLAGVMDATNSLVGAQAYDRVGGNSTTGQVSTALNLGEGYAVVGSSLWGVGNATAASGKGAATWLNLNTGQFADGSTQGEVSALNSLVGSQASLVVNGFTYADRVGDRIVKLSNNNYVVSASGWNNQNLSVVGALTLGQQKTGVVGVVSADNSIIGRASGDAIFLLKALPNGNFVAGSEFVDAHDGSGVRDVGAVAWVSGTTGRFATGEFGAFSLTNALYGAQKDDRVGSRVESFSNGNFLVISSAWNNDAINDAGAVTWVNGSNGTMLNNLVGGLVSASNSLVGSSPDDIIGGRTSGSPALPPKSDVSDFLLVGSGEQAIVNSGWWDNQGVLNTGASTWIDGKNGRLANGDLAVGVLSAANSLVGSSENDQIGRTSDGTSFIDKVSERFYTIWMPKFDNGTLVDAGAVMLVDSGKGVVGTVNTGNALLGARANDQLASRGASVTYILNQGRVFAINTSTVDSATKPNVGAMVFFDLTTGTLLGSGDKGGVISESNAVFGDVANTPLKVSFLANATADGNALAFVDSANNRIRLPNFSGMFGVIPVQEAAVFANNPAANNTLTVDSLLKLLNAGTAVTLQANNDITLTDALNVNNTNGAGGALKLEAGRNINFNAALTTDDANVTAIAGSANAIATHRDAGDPTITLGNGASINAGKGTIHLVTVGDKGKFVNNAGANAVTADKTFIYLPGYNTAGNTVATLGGLVAGYRYNTTFNATTGAPQSTTAKLDNLTGVNLLYAAAPTLQVAPSLGQTAVYGDTIKLSNTNSLSGFVNGDTATTTNAVSGTAVFKVETPVPASGRLNAGKHNVTYASGLASDLGYSFADATTQVDELTIDQKAVTISGITAADKDYDGNKAATVDTTKAVYTGLVEGEALSTTATGEFASKDASATAQTVSLTATTTAKEGTKLSNYKVTLQANTTAKINQKAITVSGITASDKTYDGNKTATVNTTNAQYDGLVQGDALSTTATGEFASKDASATAQTVNLTATTTAKEGTKLSNYKVTEQANTTAKINKAKAEVIAGSATKTYNGSTQSIGADDFTVTGLVNNETKVVLSGVTVAGSAKDVGTYTTKASGTDTNYELTFKDGNLTLEQALMLYVANQTEVFQGQTPTLTGTVTGFVGADTQTNTFSGATPQWITDGNINQIGTYAVRGTGLISKNYRLLQADSNARALVVKAATQDTTTSNAINIARVSVPNNSTPPAQLQVNNVNTNNASPTAGSNSSQNSGGNGGDSNTPPTLQVQGYGLGNSGTLNIINGGVNVGNTLSGGNE